MASSHPFTPGGLVISLIRVCLDRSASVLSCRLVGKSLPGKTDKKIARVFGSNSFSILFVLLLILRRRTLGWPLAISQEERLSYGIGSPLYARRLRDFVDLGAFKSIYFFIMLPASGGIASRDVESGILAIRSKILLANQN
ncbi:hypothetical protein AY633_08130 [Planococcus maritimus]|nr:hypothetical protein AY633_08130 [Planococcus maritimus]